MLFRDRPGEALPGAVEADARGPGDLVHPVVPLHIPRRGVEFPEAQVKGPHQQAQAIGRVRPGRRLARR
jgi:hypothetical protein